MSFSLSRAAWDFKCKSSTQKLVLLALADYADQNGNCWPSVEAIAKKTQLSGRAVYDALKVLLADKTVLLMENGGTGFANRYRVNLIDCAPNSQHMAQRTVHHAHRDCAPVADQPIRNLSGTGKGRQSRHTPKPFRSSLEKELERLQAKKRELLLYSLSHSLNGRTWRVPEKEKEYNLCLERIKGVEAQMMDAI